MAAPMNLIFALQSCCGHAPKKSLGFAFFDHSEELAQFGFHVFSLYDEIQKAMFEEKFGGLETFGQVFAYCFFDDAGAGKADECSGFSDVNVAQHGK